MAKQVINIGSAPNDGTGDSARNAGSKINANFTELYDHNENLSDLAYSGDYSDVNNTPTLSTVGTSGDYNDLSNLPTLGTVASQDGYAVPAGGTINYVLSKASADDGDFEWVEQTGGGGGGDGITEVSEDTSPSLGGDLTLGAFSVGDAAAADLTKLSEITATSTELNYVDGVTSALQTQLDAKLEESLFDDNTILKADTNNTPVVLTVGESTVVGRAAGGVIAALTGAQVRTIINVEDAATGDQTAAEIVTALETLTGDDRLEYTAVDELDSAAAGILFMNAITAQDAEDQRDWLISIQGVAIQSGETPVEDAPIVGALADGQVKYAGTISASYATPVELATGTDDVKLLNVETASYWRKSSTLTFANPATIVLDGATHTLFPKMSATGNSAIQVGAIAAGLEGEIIHVEVAVASGTPVITLQSHAGTGATLVVADDVTAVTIGGTVGNVAVYNLEIVTTGTTGKVRLISSYSAAS